MRFTFILLVALISTAAFGQEEDMTTLHANYVFYWEHYYSIGWGSDELFHIGDLGLSQEFESKKSREEYQLIGDSIDGDYARELCFFYALDNLNKLLQHVNFKDFPLDSLDESIAVTISADSLLMNYTIDENTGGTYLSQISYVIYWGNKPLHFQDEVLDEANDYDYQSDTPFHSDGYFEIDTINTAQGVVYHLSGEVKGCSTCIGTYHDFVRFDDDSLVWLDGLEIMSRYQGAFTVWNQSQKLLTLEYIEDDLNEGYNCIDVDDREENEIDDETIDDSIVHICEFKFNGEALDLIRTSEKPYNPDDY